MQHDFWRTTVFVNKQMGDGLMADLIPTAEKIDVPADRDAKLGGGRFESC
jgi:hypothetical protein